MLLADIRSQVRQRLNIENATHITDAELNTYINASGAEHRELTVEAGELWQTKRTVITIPAFDPTAADDGYTLPTDLYKIIRLDRIYGTNLSAPLTLINVQDESYHTADYNLWFDYDSSGSGGLSYSTDINEDGLTTLRVFPRQQQQGDYKLIYYPMWTDKVDGYQFQIGPSGQHWEEYIITDVCLKCCLKDETDPSGFIKQKQDMIERINHAASMRDAGQGVAIPSGRWSDRRRVY